VKVGDCGDLKCDLLNFAEKDITLHYSALFRRVCFNII